MTIIQREQLPTIEHLCLDLLLSATCNNDINFNINIYKNRTNNLYKIDSFTNQCYKPKIRLSHYNI